MRVLGILLLVGAVFAQDAKPEPSTTVWWDVWHDKEKAIRAGKGTTVEKVRRLKALAKQTSWVWRKCRVFDISPHTPPKGALMMDVYPMAVEGRIYDRVYQFRVLPRLKHEVDGWGRWDRIYIPLAVTVGAWDAYVAQFVAQFSLDDAQRLAAGSVLVDVKARAEQYSKAHAVELQAATREITQATKEQRKSIMDDKAELMQPLNDLFAELKSRLEQIPTEAQRSQAQPTAQPEPAGNS